MPIWTLNRPASGPVEYTTEQADLRAAYNRGRLDERLHRRSHPFIVIAVVVLALTGAWLLFLAAREGSFASAGVVADQNVAAAAQEAKPALRQTGEAIKDAGVTLKDKSENLIQPRDKTASTEPALR